MDKRTRGCLLIGLGLGVLLVVAGIALVGGAGYWLFHQMAFETTDQTPEEAQVEMEAARARFAGQEPFLVLVNDRVEPRPGLEPAYPEGEAPPLQSLRILAFDPRDRQLVRLRFPFWLIRLAPEGRVSVGDTGLRDVQGVDQLTVRQLEALGPGLLLDITQEDGGRVLVWTE